MAERKWFKGKAALAVDSWYSTGNVQRNLEEARDLLQSPRSFEAIVQHLAGVDHGDSAFVHPHPDSVLQGPTFESVMRQGLLEAIALALGHAPPVPIKMFWMTGAGNGELEMHITDETAHVSVMLLVPEVEGGEKHADSPESWVVHIDGSGQVQTRQTSGPSTPTPPSARGAASG